MDLAIGSLIGVAGKLFNASGKTPRKNLVIRQSIPADEKPSGTNIYQNTRSSEVDQQVRAKADTQWRKSMDPVSTNVIPPYFNFEMQDQINKFHSKEKQSKIFGGPMFANEITSGLDKSVTPNTLTGQPIEGFHNNMVPFIKDKNRQNTNDRIYEGRLETFTGIGQLVERRKKEMAPLFQAPPENITGTPNLPENLREERFTAALSNNKTNLLPAPQIRQAWFDPLDVRPIFRNVDEMRTSSNPKLQFSFEGVTPEGINQAMTKRGILAKPTKNKQQPLLHDGIAYSVPGASYLQKNKVDPEYIMRYTNKPSYLRSHFGNAGRQGTNEQGGRYRRRDQTNAGGIDALIRPSFKGEVQTPLENLPFNSPYEAPTKRWYDKPKTTMRQLRNMSLTGNIGGEQVQNATAYVIGQANARFKPTHRQTTQYTYRGNGGAPVNAPMSEHDIRNMSISDKKAKSLRGFTPGAARGVDNIGVADIGEYHYNPRFNEVENRRKPIITGNALEKTNFSGNYGRQTRDALRALNHADNRLDPSILDQLDTNDLVIH